MSKLLQVFKVIPVLETPIKVRLSFHTHSQSGHHLQMKDKIGVQVN
jgi:hypothetical protein